jgi:hypothetical protein
MNLKKFLAKVLIWVAAINLSIFLFGASPSAFASTCTNNLASTSSVTDSSTSTLCVLRINSGTNTWTAPSNVSSINILSVGGGGGGGQNLSGGGGGGLVVIANSLTVTPGSSYSLSVGAGGSGAAVGGNGNNGSPSVFGALISATGGGGGAVQQGAGNAGGSSGGNGEEKSGAPFNAATQPSTYSGSGTSYGNAGGRGGPYASKVGGGGGGAGGVGSDGISGHAGNGGPGLQVTLNANGSFTAGSGTAYYGAGGGGGSDNGITPGSGGTGGGGAGGQRAGSSATGIGAGGGGSTVALAGDGSTGVIILTYTYVSPTTLSVSASSNLTYRVSGTLTANLGVAGSDGRVTFYANGKRIPTCVNILSVSLTAICAWKPSIHGAIQISATLIPSSGIFSASSSGAIGVGVKKRSNTR